MPKKLNINFILHAALVWSAILCVGVLASSRLAQATSGACSGHGGVDCAAGADSDGSVICYDGWRNSSVSYASMVKCASTAAPSSVSVTSGTTNTTAGGAVTVGPAEERLSGRILLQVQAHGEAWYVNPVDRQRYYMRDGATAYQMMREFGLGITNNDLASIPTVADADAMKSSASACVPGQLSDRVKGKILLQVQAHGEAWYVDPDKCRRIYLKDGDAAYQIMRFLSLGITDGDLGKISVGD